MCGSMPIEQVMAVSEILIWCSWDQQATKTRKNPRAETRKRRPVPVPVSVPCHGIRTKSYFSTVIRGEGKVFNLIEIPYRQNISFADIRDKLVEDCFTRFLGVDVDSLRFYSLRMLPAN